jgi:hypothetical protein
MEHQEHQELAVMAQRLKHTFKLRQTHFTQLLFQRLALAQMVLPGKVWEQPARRVMMEQAAR